ncbi:MAG: molybdopterin synthase sulfur carrier subunit [Bacteroidetes bacterium]|nr:molybdopterin synthase sulfur carrier subunit [Bacteroidota bacterium]
MKILFFGITKEIVGRSELEWNGEIPENINSLRKILAEKYPAISGLKSIAFAVNERYANDDQRLDSKDVVAVIPPVSGG